MTHLIDINALYKQTQEALVSIHDYFLVSNSTGITLEKKGGFFLSYIYKKTMGSSYAIEESAQKILDLAVKKHDETGIDSLEAIKLSKICFAIGQIVAHSLKKKTLTASKDASSLQAVKKKLELLELGFLTKAAAKDNISPFLCACKHTMFSHAIALINEKTDLKEAREYYSPLLRLSYEKNEIKLCFKLLELGASPKAIENPIHLLAAAINEQAMTAAIQLINSEIDLNQPIDDQGQRVLHLACKQGLEEIVRILCAKGALYNIQDREGNTALHSACMSIQIEIALFLNESGADAAITNHKGVAPFSLPSLCTEPDLQEKIKIFYNKLFEDIPFARDKIPSIGFSYFINACHSNPKNLIKDTIKTSPFEVALLLQDQLLAKDLVTKFSKQEFINSIEKLHKKYPHATLDLIEFSHLSLSSDHLSYQLPEIKILPPSEPVDINELLTLFEKISFKEKTSPYFLDLGSLKADIKNRSKSHLKEQIEKIIHRIKNKEYFMGTPRKGTPAMETFYETIENSFKSIILFFRKTPQDTSKAHLLISFFGELIRTANLCAGRYFLTAVLEHNKICSGFSPSFEEEILLSLAEYRRLLIHSCIDQEDKDNANKYGYVLRNLGKELAIPEATIMASYIDQYGWVDKEQVRRRFFELYTPKNIQKEWIEPLFKENGTLREKFIDWMKKHIPSDWKKGLIKDREEVYLATEVFDMSTGLIRPSAISYMLTKMSRPPLSSSFT